MAKQVIKSTGEKEAFSAKKIIGAITRAAKDANLTPEEINSVVNLVSNKAVQFAEAKDKVMSSEIRDFILTELDTTAPTVAAEWRRYMNASKK